MCLDSDSTSYYIPIILYMLTQLTLFLFLKHFWKKSIFARTLLTNDWIFHGLYVEFAQTAKNSFQVALFDINFDHTNARWFTSYFLEFIIMVFHTTATGVMILIQNIFPGKKSCEKLYPGGPQSETVGI